MSVLQVRPFVASDVQDAAELLADRHRAHRTAQPLLDPEYEDSGACVPHIAAIIASETGSGAVAVRGRRMVGYLVGSEKSQSWGSNVWIESAGMAVERAEDMRDLYAVAAQRWFDEGRTSHFALTPAHDATLVDAWYRLGFGQQHAHAIQPSRVGNTGDRVEIRRAQPTDLDSLAQLDLELPLHQGRSPTFSAGEMPTLEEARQDWLESFDDQRFCSFVAVRNGEVVGAATACSLQVSSAHQGPASVDNAGFLGFAAVLPNARGLGAGRALGEAVIGWSHEAGYASVVTDWRVTNLLASRAWPALGFGLTFLRLVRNIGPAG